MFALECKLCIGEDYFKFLTIITVTPLQFHICYLSILLLYFLQTPFFVTVCNCHTE